MTRPSMPEGLYVSVSQVKCFLRCPRQFELKYVRGLPPAFVPVNLAFGSAVHEALAAYYSELKNVREPLRRDLVLDVFRSAWEKAVDGPVPLQAEDEDGAGPGALVDLGVSMLHAFYENAAARPSPVVEAVEQRFEVEIRDPDTGDVLEERLVGVIDLVVIEAGRRVLYEHKTSSKKYTADQLRYDVQPTAYRLALGKLGAGAVGMKYQVLTKTKIPAIQIAEVARTEQDEDDLLRTVQGVLRAIDVGVSYPIRGWQCRTCPYSRACRGQGT